MPASCEVKIAFVRGKEGPRSGERESASFDVLKRPTRFFVLVDPMRLRSTVRCGADQLRAADEVSSM